MYLQQRKLNAKKNVIELCSPCHFETAIFTEFFSLINFMFVGRK